MGRALLFCLTILAANADSENESIGLETNSGHFEKAAECVMKLSAKYFVEKKALSGSIVIININSYSSKTERLLLSTIHGGMKYSVMVKDSFYRHANASHFPEKAKNYMLILEEKSELTRNIKQLNKLPTWNPLAKAVVYYVLKDGENAETTSIGFINELRSYKLLKTIILIFSNETNEIIAFTWKPYSVTNCGGECDSVYVLDRCKEGSVVQEHVQLEMFPADTKGCPLVVHAVVSEPYVMPPIRKQDGTGFNDTYMFNRGAEINLLNIISQFTNTTLFVRTSDIPENWGTIDSYGNATGAYGMLRNDLVDLVIGNIEVTRKIRKFFDPTVSYTQDEMTWCVPKAGQAPTWDNLVIIFQWSTWVATFVSLVAMGLIFHYLYYKEQIGKITKWPTNSLLMTLSMLLGWGSQFEPKSATFRILIFGWLCFSINMGINYESFLRSFLMHPRYEKQISTESDIVRSEIPVGGREIYRSYFETNNTISSYLYRKYNSTTFEQGIRRAAFENFAVVSSRRQAEYMDQSLGKGAQLIYCFPESDNLYKYGVVLLARKWFPFLNKYNNIIRSVSENGLIEKWNKELFIHSSSVDGTGSIVPLSVDHLLGAFMFIGFMYAVSIVVFFAEMSSGYLEQWKRKKTPTILVSVIK